MGEQMRQWRPLLQQFWQMRPSLQQLQRGAPCNAHGMDMVASIVRHLQTFLGGVQGTALGMEVVASTVTHMRTSGLHKWTTRTTRPRPQIPRIWVASHMSVHVAAAHRFATHAMLQIPATAIMSVHVDTTEIGVSRVTLTQHLCW